ncbi:MAG: hypothetical protein ACOC5K_02735 [Chloroflexota bacterium]
MVAEEAREYLDKAYDIVRAAEHWHERIDDGWLDASTTSEYAALLLVQGSRNGVLCDAAAVLDPPPEALGAHRTLGEYLEARQGWAVSAVSALRAGRPVDADQLEEAHSASSNLFQEAVAAMQGVAQRTDVEYGPRDVSYPAVNERARSTLEAPPGWILARLDSQTVLVGPPELQGDGLPGLGADGSGHGTSLSVRRVRNRPDWSLEEALEQSRPQIPQFGELRSEREVRVDGHDGFEWRIVDPGAGWETRVAVVVAGDYTFFLEFGCPSVMGEECRGLMNELLSGVQLHV